MWLWAGGPQNCRAILNLVDLPCFIYMYSIQTYIMWLVKKKKVVIVLERLFQKKRLLSQEQAELY